MFSVLWGVLAGVILGCVSGLIPGIHSNTMAGLTAALAVPLTAFFGVDGVCCMIVSLMVVHTFLDCVPSTFIGVPDADTVLSVLPAHQLYLDGKGEEAVRVSALGSAYGFVFCLPLFAVFMTVLPAVQGWIDWAIGLVILLAAGLLIVFSRMPGWALAVFAVSGLLGIFSMRFSYFSGGLFGTGEVLLPLLTGLFGIPVLLQAACGANAAVPQKFCGILAGRRKILMSCLKGTAAGAVVGWLPGFSSGTANALLAVRRSGDFERSDPRGYLLATSAANTANAVLGIAALLALGRMRSGAMAALSNFALPNVFLLLAAAGAAAVAGYLLTAGFSRAGAVAARLNQRALAICVGVFLVVMSGVFCGPFGLLILLPAAAVGLVPQMTGVSRIFCMGAIMLPVMLFTLGMLTF